MSDILILNADELRQLAELIYWQELDAYKGMVFHSNDDSNKYQEDCENTYNSAMAVLKASEDADTKYKQDKTKSSIAHQMFKYVQVTMSTSFQIVVNYSIRALHIQKLGDHTYSLLDTLEKLDTEDVTEVERFSNEVAEYKEAMTKFLEKYKSDISTSFSEWVRTTEMSFEDLLTSYHAKLGYEGAFTDLEEAQKIKVYNEILKDAGVGDIFKMEIKEACGAELLLLCAAVMVWDIFTAKQKIERASRDAGEIASNIGGAMLGDIVEGFVEGALAESCEVATYVAIGVGFLASFAGAFIIGAVAAALLDIIFASGGSAPLKTDGIRCYALRIPDPVAQAWEIRYDTDKKKLSSSSTT